MFPIKSNAAIPKTTITAKDEALHTVFLEPRVKGARGDSVSEHGRVVSDSNLLLLFFFFVCSTDCILYLGKLQSHSTHLSVGQSGLF